MSQKQAVKRDLNIIARIYIKKTCTSNGVQYVAGSVVLLVENDKGVRYTVTLRRTHVHSCTCDHVSTRKSLTCYHIDDCAAIENAREAEAKKTLAAMALAQEVEAFVVEVEKELAREIVPARELAPLNNRNRGFSLLRR